MNGEGHTGKAAPAGDPDLAAILTRVACLLSDIHLDGLAMQREFGALMDHLSEVPANLTELQRLDTLSQMHSDLAAFVHVLARDVRHGTVDKTRLGDALRLGSLRHKLLSDDPGETLPEVPHGDVAFF